MNDLKLQLYNYCADYIAKKEAGITQAINDARESAGNETKSSAGDKYETAREMIQQEIDMNMVRLNEVKLMKASFERINKELQSNRVIPGSLVRTGSAAYYIAISAGTIKINNVTYYAVSPSSPIGALLMGKSADNAILFNGKNITIDEVS